jgi:hypothetical protein
MRTEEKARADQLQPREISRSESQEYVIAETRTNRYDLFVS